MASFWNRFYPLNALRLAVGHASRSPTTSQVRLDDPNLHAQLMALLELLFSSDHGAKRATEQMAEETVAWSRSQQNCLRLVGHIPYRAPSQTPNAGMGVYIKVTSSQTRLVPKSKVLTSACSSTIPSGALVCLYPGTCYRPGVDPVLLQSLRNHYMLRRMDGVFIDGKPHGLSGWVYRSLHRQYFYPGAKWPPCDDTWLLKKDQLLRNPFAIGQYVNNANTTEQANVRYAEFDLELATVPIHLHQYLPNAPYRADPGVYPRLAALDYNLATPIQGRGVLPLVLLVSTRTIRDGEELFSTYHDMIGSAASV